MNNQQLFEKFLNNELSTSERIEFTKRLNNDLSLASEFNLYKEINTVLSSNSEHINLRKKLEAIYNSESNTYKLYSNIIKYAASIIILISIATLLHYYVFNSLSNDELYARYYKPYKVILNTRSTNNSKNTLIIALQKYSTQNYSEAATIFEAYLNTNSDNIAAKFYYANCLMQTNQHNQAIPLLGDIINNNNNLFIENAHWYIALCYIKINDYIKAKKSLLYLVENKSIYKSQAETILKKMK